jgi:hypothetical protein
MRAIERSEMALIGQHEREQTLQGRHCEERSDEATQGRVTRLLGRFAALAMTN